MEAGCCHAGQLICHNVAPWQEVVNREAPPGLRATGIARRTTAGAAKLRMLAYNKDYVEHSGGSRLLAWGDAGTRVIPPSRSRLMTIFRVMATPGAWGNSRSMSTRPARRPETRGGTLTLGQALQSLRAPEAVIKVTRACGAGIGGLSFRA